ncbi:uncharacterized protein LOC135681086 [Rhopilema esculentum]|uniref:uncharacterized protein LOC135681086 n=1 Tax=Rhopilema esculentum TaxID=499914 RepID=UPI0031D11C7A
MLYLLRFNVEYRGLSQPELLKVWVKEAQVALAAKESGMVKEIWKIVGERKVLVVIESESPEKVDQLSFDLPIMKEIGNQVKIEVTPIIPYYSFANFLFENFGEEKSAKASDTGVDVAKEGIFYWLVFNIEYAGMSRDELLEAWVAEAKHVLETQEKVKDGLCVWKSVGKREVHVLIRVQRPDDLDAMSLDLPIMRKIGNQVKIECKSVRPYKDFAEDLMKRV